MHEIKVHVQGCNRGRAKAEACRVFLVDVAARFLEQHLDSGRFVPDAAWRSRFTDEQRRVRKTLLVSPPVKDHLEDLRLKIERKLLEKNEVSAFSLADIIEMGLGCVGDAGFDLEEEGALLRASKLVELEPYAVSE